VFVLPNQIEVDNYLLWRRHDCEKNAVSMAAAVHFSQRELHGKSTEERRSMLLEEGIDFDDYPNGFRHGTMITKQEMVWLVNGVPLEGPRSEWVATALDDSMITR
jgi:tRNA(His) 5'-end guanylyltransferase